MSIVLLVGALLLSGCAHSSGATWRGSERVKQYNAYLAGQNWKGALDIVREEIANPESLDNTHLAVIRMFGIEVLGKYTVKYGLQPGFDDEAKRYYEEGVRYASQDELQQARLNYTLGFYYQNSRRSGFSIPYYRKDLAYNEKTGDTFHVILDCHNLAGVYANMGEFTLRDFYRVKALDTAEKYFLMGEGPSKANEWVQYYNILLARASELADSGNANEIAKIWLKMEPIVIKYLSPKTIPYMQMSKLFAVSGDLERARALYRQAESVWQQESKRQAHLAQVIQLDLTCADAQIQLFERQYKTAVQSFDRCFELRSLTRMLESDPATHHAQGMAYEGAGDLPRAADAYAASIREFEKMRSSYSVAERATFFRTGVRKSYWGLIRVWAKRAAESGKEDDFLITLQSTERMRSRQLGELVDPQAEAEMPLDSLRTLRSQLGPDTVVLDYTLMDETIVLLAFDKERYSVGVIPYSSKDFSLQLSAVAKALSDAHSPLKNVQNQLFTISKTLLASVAPLLDKKTQVLVLPDGAMNLIPFDLLSADQSAYQLLLQDKVVWAVSSLKLFRPRQERDSHDKNAGLFALGDPVYAKVPQVEGITQAEIEAVTRGHAYLSYFSSLPETRTEVESISRLFSNEPVRLVLGEQARKSTIKNTNLQPFRYVHLATHGILGGEVPGIGEPALVLGEEPSEDGFLRASEVETLKLNADLAVLSACNTGSGELVTGEGLMGLSRAFLVAGSRAVLVSLWSVASKETEQMMVIFYRHLQSGMDTAEALRKAKLELMADHPHPFYWAPFILVGR